jgi:hypothetical protein
MSRTWIFAIVVAYPVMAMAQTGSTRPSEPSVPYQPAVPAASVNNYNGWGGGYPGASTVAASPT